MQRIKVNKNRNYTTINNEFMRNGKLSLKAMGLMAFLLSLPDDWDLSIKGVDAIIKDGLYSIRGSIKELIEAGYMERVHVFGGWDYIVYEQAVVKDSHTCENDTCGNHTYENHTCGNHTYGNPTQISKDLNKDGLKQVKTKISKEVKGPNKSNSSLFIDMKDMWMNYYKTEKQLDFYFDGKAAGSLKQLISKIKFLNNDSDENKALATFQYMLVNLKAADEWVFNHLSLNVINSQFSPLTAKMKNGKGGNKYANLEAEANAVINANVN